MPLFDDEQLQMSKDLDNNMHDEHDRERRDKSIDIIKICLNNIIKLTKWGTNFLINYQWTLINRRQ